MRTQTFSAWRNRQTQRMPDCDRYVRSSSRGDAGSTPAALINLPIKRTVFGPSSLATLLLTVSHQWVNGACARRPEAGECCCSSAGISTNQN